MVEHVGLIHLDAQAFPLAPVDLFGVKPARDIIDRKINILFSPEPQGKPLAVDKPGDYPFAHAARHQMLLPAVVNGPKDNWYEHSEVDQEIFFVDTPYFIFQVDMLGDQIKAAAPDEDAEVLGLVNNVVEVFNGAVDQVDFLEEYGVARVCGKVGHVSFLQFGEINGS